MPIAAAHAACLADRRRSRASARRRSPIAWRVSCWRIPIPAAARGAGRDVAGGAADNPVARRIAAQAHSDLLVLERTLERQRQAAHRNRGRRRAPQRCTFFGSTAGEGGWRVCIVDSADELNRDGANALLKILEEPPARRLLLVVSHAPGRLLPTIRSRCRRLMLRPLGARTMSSRAAAAALGDCSRR